jgi:RNA polymerase sigma-70 factor (ECF subfamily)
MYPTRLRSPEERVGTLPNADLPPPDEDHRSAESLLRSALIDGDTQAFREVTRRLDPLMTRVARRYVRSPEDAQDVVQDTWLSALASIGRFEGRASLRTWLLRILTYRARTAGRRAARAVPMSRLQPSTPGRGEAPQWEPETPLFGRRVTLPDEDLMAAELRSSFAAALTRLPPRQREVFTLREFEGWSSAEVAARLDLSEANQRVLLHRARAALREQLLAA